MGSGVKSGQHPYGSRAKRGQESKVDSTRRAAERKGVRSQKCTAPVGPFRLLTPDPFSPDPFLQRAENQAVTKHEA